MEEMRNDRDLEKERLRYAAAIGKWVKDRRLQLGMTQGEFATRTGLHKQRISHIETGRYDFQLSTLIVVARGLGVSVSELVRAADAVNGGRRKRRRKRMAERV
jgi:transcriptional regulator with XRE-family HTH domain